ncbi:hypothetical protein D5R81_11940 [Parashewanella spongiae]|uniref:DUF6957 domain-containing protein n=1 Tax=Parashewanella spongiae TaxID=342950 RepID=A0A3A6TD10_9GAMM|nr:hypothetical protein [Parashewanella spongiae]MCL1078614.1 hypothetical protein [Parashewanella spongiae]RJY13017.1 hypothetical protein D5R81_11940 [Parashewanella spongiae]
MSPLDSLDKLERTSSAFCNKGDHFDVGCSEDDVEKYRALSHTLILSKKVCIVKNWLWWDIDVPKNTLDLLTQNRLHPVMVKADTVIEDEAGRFHYGDWVRTSFLTKFTDNCIFETKNTVYLLVGSGMRKSVSLDVALSLF